MDGHTHTNPQGYDPGCPACNGGPAVMTDDQARAILTQPGPGFAGVFRGDTKTELAKAKEGYEGIGRQLEQLRLTVERALESETRPDSEQAENLERCITDLKAAETNLWGASYYLDNC